MTPEDKQYRASLEAAKRINLLNKDEMWPQRQPVFPIMALHKAYEEFISKVFNGNATEFYNHLLHQTKTEEQEEKDLFTRLMYRSLDDINFGRWLAKNGWEPSAGAGNWKKDFTDNVQPITALFNEYKFQTQ